MEARRTIRQQFDDIGLKVENIELLFDVFMKNGRIFIPIQYVTLTRDHFIYRARQHDPRVQFTKKSDVSYNQDLSNIHTGRANMLGNPVFYGAIASKEIPEGRLIAMQESSEIRYGRIPDVQTFTVSRWRPKHEVELAAFVPSAILAAGMGLAKEMHHVVEDMLASIPVVDDKERAREMIDVLSQEFSKDVESTDDYWISAIFASLIYQNSAGIAYPSKRTEYQGFNIAVPGNVWDENFDLIDSWIFQYHLIGGEVFIPEPYKVAIAEEPFLWRDATPEHPRLPFKLHPYPHYKPV